jgi:uncharacterized protein (TIGR02594 family)
MLSQAEAIRLQRCLNVALDRIPPLRTDGGIGPRSQAAIRDLQRRLGVAETGEADAALLAAAEAEAAARGWKPAVAPGSGFIPAWVEVGRNELGVKELPGAQHHPRILDYLATMPGLPPEDETPWCACFTAWCLLRAGIEVPPTSAGGPSAAARSWMEFGSPVEGAPLGAIAVVFNRNRPAHTTASGFHVAFLAERGAKGVKLLGGNQGNTVSEVAFNEPAWELKALRWPG